MNFTMDMLMKSEFTMKNSNKTVYVTNTKNGDYLYIIEDNGTFENKVYKFNTMEEDVMPFIFKYIKDSNMNDIYLPNEEYKKMFNKQLVFHYNQDDIDKETYNYIKNKDKLEIHINIQN